MLQLNQINLWGIFGFTATIAGTLAWGQQWHYAAILAGLGSVLICTEILTRNLPKGISQQMENNCIRADGSWSNRRADFEKSVARKTFRKILVLLLVILIPSLFLLWLFDQQVAPISVGAQALAGYEVSEADWKANLTGAEQSLEKWHHRSIWFRNVESHKRFLWRCWPLLIGGWIFWLGLCCLILRNGYLSILKKVNSDAKYREHLYRQRDLSRVIDQS